MGLFDLQTELNQAFLFQHNAEEFVLFLFVDPRTHQKNLSIKLAKKVKILKKSLSSQLREKRKKKKKKTVTIVKRKSRDFESVQHHQPANNVYHMSSM